MSKKNSKNKRKFNNSDILDILKENFIKNQSFKFLKFILNFKIFIKKKKIKFLKY
jgi:hypothetical protein